MIKYLFLLMFLTGCQSNPKCKCDEGMFIPETNKCEVRYYVAPVCTMDYNPVCGCDGQTYSNACVAHFNGVVWFINGACKDALH